MEIHTLHTLHVLSSLYTDKLLAKYLLDSIEMKTAGRQNRFESNERSTKKTRFLGPSSLT